MITAQEARKMTESVTNNEIQNDIENIERAIIKATNEGSCEITVVGNISLGAAEYLRNLGYHIHIESLSKETYFTVRW